MGGQGTYDPIKIKELVGGRAWEHPSLLKVYGLNNLEQALHPTAEQRALYDEASAITHLTKDDPPLFMIYSEPDIVPPANSKPGQFIHHPNFGKQLKKEMDALGSKTSMSIPTIPREGTLPWECSNSFNANSRRLRTDRLGNGLFLRTLVLFGLFSRRFGSGSFSKRWLPWALRGGNSVSPTWTRRRSNSACNSLTVSAYCDPNRNS